MRKLIFHMATSIDGYLEGLNREIDWHIVKDDFKAYINELVQNADILVMGRITYQLVADFWSSPAALRTDPATAKMINDAQKIVFSKTLKNVEWQNTTLVNTDPVKEIRRLKEMPGGYLLMGSSDLALSLVKEGLIDEFRINLNPIILGSGKTVFTGLDQRVPLKLIKTQVFDSGVVVLTYQPD